MTFHKIHILLILLIANFPNCIYSQSDNLIPNYSFEEFNSLPDDVGQGVKCILQWYINVYEGKGDYYHTNSKSKRAGTDKNYFGNQEPHSGRAYAGICISKKFREFLHVKLTNPLIKGKQYKIQIFISCADKKGLSTVNEFNILFSNELFYVPDNVYLKSPPQICFTNINNYDNKEDWIELSTIYTADGTESRLTFGTFLYKENEKEHGEIFGIMKYAHYYVDDISISLVTKDSIINPPAQTNIDKSYLTGETYIFDNVQFETGKSNLLPSSYEELDSLIIYLKNASNVKIRIIGHTDNVGSSVDNMRLSYDRANTVKQYILEREVIDEKSIIIEGKGDTKPILPNDTEESRKKNRRVEISFL